MASVSRCKAIVLGDKAVGKTSILNCLLGYPVPFSKRYNTTKGVNIVSKSIKLIESRESDSCLVDIYFYDFSGRSVYSDLVRSLWANNVSLVIGVFDVTREESFYQLQTILSDYMKQFGKHLNDNQSTPSSTTNNATSFSPLGVVGVILGNKVDLTEQRSVDEDESQQWAKHIRMRYFDVSAKDNIGIEESFNHLVRSWSDTNRTN